jgi:glycosyltransferase involved in cell wall biosynthesis
LTNTPRFSVIVTFHNQKNFVRDALDSVFLQEHAEFEVIVVDDASTDGTPSTLREYAPKIRLELLNDNVGACAARNHGASVARGEYLVFLDGDDALLPWALRVYERIVATTGAKFLLCGMKWFQDSMEGQQAGPPPVRIRYVEYVDYFRRDRRFGHSASSMVIECQAFHSVNGWLVGFFPSEDVELAMRLGVAGRTVHILDPPTVWHRAHSGNSINNVLSFMPAMYSLLAREKQGCYPGGAARRFERHALLGGMTFHWVKRAAQSAAYTAAFKLFARSFPMFVASIARKSVAKARGKQPVQTVAVEPTR